VLMGVKEETVRIGPVGPTWKDVSRFILWRTDFLSIEESQPETCDCGG
jgi:hypothetical protein